MAFLCDVNCFEEVCLSYAKPPQEHACGREGEHRLQQKEAVLVFRDVGHRLPSQLSVSCLHNDCRFPIWERRAIVHPQCVRLVDEKGMHNRPTEVATHDSFLFVASQPQTHSHVPSQGVYAANEVGQPPKLKYGPVELVQVEVKITGRNTGNFQIFWGHLWHQGQRSRVGGERSAGAGE